MDIVAADAEAVYGTNGRHHRLVIHELCKMATSPLSVRQSKEEFSDDERDEDLEEVTPAAEEDGSVARQNTYRQNATIEGQVESEALAAGEEMPTDKTPVHIGGGGTGCPDCDECEQEMNAKICEVAQFMIDTSHSLGPMRVFIAQDDEEDDQEDEHIHEGHLVGEDGKLYQFHESILTVPDSRGKTPLHILCENSCDAKLMRVILGSTRENTGNPSAPTAFSLITAKDSRGSTALHYLAYSRQCPFSSLQMMMDFCKPTCPSKDNNATIDPSLCCDTDGDTPLHWALEGYMSPRRIKELIRYSRGAVVVQNNSGKRPFDKFAENFVDPDWKVHDVVGREVWENIQAYLRVLFDGHSSQLTSMSDQNDDKKLEWLPLHLLASSPYPLPVVFVDIAIHYCEEDLSKVNERGMLPLHLACQRRNIDPDFRCDGILAHKILSAHPQAAYKGVTTNKRLALHLAVSTQKPMSLITALIKSYPRSLNSPDPLTRLWPFVLAGVDNDISMGVSFTLLRADPSILQLAMKDDKKKSLQRASELANQLAESELEDQSSRRIRRLTIRDRYES
jgi:hypothetical protein